MDHLYDVDHPLHHEMLKIKQRELREEFPTPLALRAHRSLSWLKRSAAERDDADVRFILLWIGFNACYAADVALALKSENQRERNHFNEFFITLVSLDAKHRIYDAVWERFPQEIRVLLTNRYVFGPFWCHHNGTPGYEDWRVRLDRAGTAVNAALARRDTARILSIVFGRLYVLRNQLVHGGATWNGEVNRAQVRDGAMILGRLLPIFVDLMMDNPGHEWPMPLYPVVEGV